MRFMQSCESINTFGQVIQQAKQEYYLDAFVRAIEAARVTDLYTCQGSIWLRLRPANFLCLSLRHPTIRPRNPIAKPGRS